MNRKIKKAISRFMISDEARKDSPKAINRVKKMFLDQIKNNGYLPTADIRIKEDRDFSEGSIKSFYYFTCRVIYVGKTKAFNKNIERRIKKHFVLRPSIIQQWW